MSWQTQMTMMVRYMINDMTAPYTYADARIQTSICIAAQLLASEIKFDKTYTIVVDPASITPDPYDTPQDDGFINIVSLGASVLVYENEAKLASKTGVSITDGPSTINMNGRLTSALALAKDIRAQFDKAKVAYMINNARSGAILLGPYTVEGLCSGNGLD